MRLEYTPLGRFLGFVVFFLFLYSFLFTNVLVAIAGALVLLFMVFSRLQFRDDLQHMGLEVKRDILDRISHKDAPVAVRMEVRAGRPVHISVRDPLPTGFEKGEGSMSGDGWIGPERPLSFTYSIVPRERGETIFEPLDMTITGSRGLLRSKERFDADTRVYVHPSKRELAMAALLGRRKRLEMMKRSSSRQARTQRSDFKSIREYIPGDRFKDIDWKAVSRLTKLMTREFDVESNVPTMILIDASMTMRELVGRFTKLDHSIAVAVQIASVLTSHGNPVGLVKYDEHSVMEHISPGQLELDDLLISMFRMPNPVRTGGYPGYQWDRPRNQGEEELPFMRSIGPFLVGKRTVYDPKRTTGIFEAVRSIGMRDETGMMLLIITDLETSREALLSAASLAKARNHRVMIASAFSWQFHLYKGILNEKVLERMYSDNVSRQGFISNLRDAGVRVIDLSPRERGDALIRAIRRAR
ncbi:MAG: DUF58 domain-containing protein [Candidatus Thermoplasmatota archaeon]|nr:DUF58 domain-containing protein [Candidatus Thermoplasmatota archaeon]